MNNETNEMSNDNVTASQELHVYVMNDENEAVVAADPTDAWLVFCEHTGGTREACGYEKSEFVLYADDKPFPITEVDEPGAPTTTKTGAEWAASQGRGYLGGSEW